MNSGYLPSKFQKATAIAGAATMLFLVTSCSAGTTQVAAAPETSAAASPSSSLSAVATTPSGPKPGDVIKRIPTKKEVANDGKGDYIQTTIADNDPAMKFDPALVTGPEASQLFTNAEIADAQKFTMRFIAEEAIDSQINNNPTDAKNIDAWWAKNKDKILIENYPLYLPLLKNSNDQTLSLVFRPNARNYSLDYGKDKTRVFNRKLTVDQIQGKTVNGMKVLSFYASGSFSMPVVVGGSVKQEDTSATFIFHVTKEPSTGKWVVGGVENTFTTNPVG